MIRIAIVDDHAVVRAGLRHFVAEHEDLQVVAEAASSREAIDVLRAHEIDVMLMDLSLPASQGLDAMAAVKARRPSLPVLIFSGQPEGRHATTLLRRGASGYLSKGAPAADLLQAIRQVHQGQRYISPALASLLADELHTQAEQALHEQLSQREMQVFLHLAQGDTVGAIAERMSLSVKTVSTYRSRLLLKLRLGGNCELTYYALKQGLIH